MNTEQWDSEGKCKDCRRKNYCTKPCTANKRRTSFEMYKAVDTATKGMLSQMMIPRR